MPDPFDGFRYIAHLRSRWRLLAIVTLAAAGLSLVVSLLVPKKYTATVSLVIEPPAGGDARVATAVSPIYLESLQTYEHFALSDELFSRATERFGLRKENRPIESLKREVLSVSLPRNTKVLEVSATLTDPTKAHEFALYMANETVKLNRETNQAGAGELIASAKTDMDEATQRLAEAESAYNAVRKREPSPEALTSDLNELGEMRVEVSRMALAAELSASDQEDREKLLTSRGDEDGRELADIRTHLKVVRSRAGRLRRRIAELEQEAASKQKTLADRSAMIESAEAEWKARRSIYEQAQKRFFDVQSTSGYQGERLTVVDPGVVPERPSSPNIPLNVFVASALALLITLFYLTVEYSLRAQQQPVDLEHTTPWVASRR